MSKVFQNLRQTGVYTLTHTYEDSVSVVEGQVDAQAEDDVLFLSLVIPKEGRIFLMLNITGECIILQRRATGVSQRFTKDGCTVTLPGLKTHFHDWLAKAIIVDDGNAMSIDFNRGGVSSNFLISLLD